MVEILCQLLRLKDDEQPMAIVQLAGFPAETTEVIVSVLFRLAFEFGVWSDGLSPVLIVCEEAHNYANADRDLGFRVAREGLSRIAVEGRKHGVFLGLITQRPHQLDPTLDLAVLDRVCHAARPRRGSENHPRRGVRCREPAAGVPALARHARSARDRCRRADGHAAAVRGAAGTHCIPRSQAGWSGDLNRADKIDDQTIAIDRRALARHCTERQTGLRAAARRPQRRRSSIVLVGAVPSVSTTIGAGRSRHACAGSRQRDHAAPELPPVAGIDVVFADELELAVVARCGKRSDRPEASTMRSPSRTGSRCNAGRDQHAAAWGRCRTCATQCCVRRCSGSASVRRSPDRWKRPPRLFWPPTTADLPSKARTVRCAIGDVDELAARMDVNCAGGLPHRRRLSDSVSLTNIGSRLSPLTEIERVDVELVLPLDRDEHPWLGRMKVEMARAEAEPVAGRDRGEVAQHAVIERECLDRAGLLGFAGFARRCRASTRCHQHGSTAW